MKRVLKLLSYKKEFTDFFKIICSLKLIQYYIFKLKKYVYPI